MPRGPAAGVERASRADLRALLDAALDAVVVIDTDGLILEFNEAAERLFRHERAAVLGQSMAELLIPERLRAAHNAGFSRHLAGGDPSVLGRRVEMPALRSDGHEMTVELGITRLESDGEVAFAAFLRDLSEAKLLEAIVRTIEERNRVLVEQLPLVTYVENLDASSASFISPQIEALLGYTPEEWTSDPVFFAKVLHPLDRERVLADFAEMHATGEPLGCEYRVVTRSGDVVWVHDAAVVVRDDDGRPSYAQGFMVDLTERKQHEQALADNEKRFRDLVGGIDAIVWESDRSLRFSFVSKPAEDILGFPIERWLAEPEFILDRFHPDDRERVLRADREVLELRKDYEIEYRVLAADDRVVWFRELVRVALDDSGEVSKLRGVMVDITGRRRADEERALLEEQLRQAHKMEAVGRLAGGVAHDFNNLLTAITGYAGLAESRLASGEAPGLIRNDLTEIQAASTRAAELIQQLLAFSRRHAPTRKVVDLGAAVREVEKLLRRLIGEEIEVVVAASAGDPLLVHADPAQLEQVLINLALNARDAMPSGGTLTIDVRPCGPEEATLQPAAATAPSALACLTISDTGHGMSPETRARIFEPFFTTKEVGKGTGLGLATVYGTVQQSGGSIAVESELGGGTTFTVFLPLAEGEVREAAGALSKARPVGTETILLVEDEEVVRNLAREALELQGYRVYVAADPEEALAGGDSEYDLLVTDVVMPKMRGPELARRLRASRPGLKVLFMSGYLDGEPAPSEGPEGAAAFLQKPFSLDDLAFAVRELLDRA